MPATSPAPGGTAAVKYSVIIPAYNAVTTLGEQFEALEAQRFDEPWEILVCDNGSTDDLAGFVDQWRERLPRLRLIDASARRGPSAAMNTGAYASRAEYLLFCDADDVVGPDWLPTFAAALRSNDFVGGHVEYDRLRPADSISVSWNSTGPFVFTLPALPELSATGSGNFGIRREVYVAVGGFEEGLQTCEDADFSWRVQLAGHPLAICDALYHVRTRQTVRSIWRQSVGWGSGQATLRHRYAKVRAALDALEPAPATASASATATADAPDSGRASRRGPAHYVGTVMRRLRAGDAKTLIANSTWQLGHRVGVRFAKPNLDTDQIEPPADLAQIVAARSAQRWVRVERAQAAAE